MEQIAVPVGYKFMPTNEQLVGHYLYRKIMGTMSLMDGLIVGECDLYGEEEPWEIWQRLGARDQDDLYLFTKLRSVCSGGSQKIRKVGRDGGNWHGEKTGKPFAVEGGMTGYYKRFVYRNPKSGQHNDSWLMMEYSLTVEGHNSDYVLCRIRKKAGTNKGSTFDSDEGSGAESSSSLSKRKRRLDHHQSGGLSDCQETNVGHEPPLTQQQAIDHSEAYQHQSSLMNPEREAAAAAVIPRGHSKIQHPPQPWTIQDRQAGPSQRVLKEPWKQVPILLDLNKPPNMQDQLPGTSNRVIQPPSAVKVVNTINRPRIQDQRPQRTGQRVMQPWVAEVGATNPPKHSKTPQEHHEPGAGQSGVEENSSVRQEIALTCEEEVVDPERLVNDQLQTRASSPTSRRIDLGQLCSTHVNGTKSCNIDLQIGPLRITIQENRESTGKISNLDDRPDTICVD
ncbi:hypothetical protein Tsubulata_005140 [Turnera subulata]|uniref:NAC domain-containing protein n=1 Tax=Turnera subulata TaxID=218843 RepID=A0A9Q0FRY3_9ROSI|nr:hypothetical protein Tsubulata_005140 [Turnera subulata]